jgi:hypothetical protein
MEIKDTTEKLAALSNESRLAIFRLLVEAGPNGLSIRKRRSSSTSTKE